MADAGAAINTQQKLTKFDQLDQFAMATSATIYQGTGTAIGSAGTVVHASQSGALYTLGVAQETHVSAAAGQTIKTLEGIFGFKNDADHSLTIANRFGPCYWTDDQTVGTDSSKLLAGVVYDVDAAGIVWVIMGPMLVTAIASGALLAANNLNDVDSASSSAHNLGLGTADSPTFTAVTLSAGSPSLTAVTATLTGLLTGVTGAFTGIVTALHKFAVKTTTYAVLNGTDSDALLQSLTDGQIFTLPASAAGNLGQEIVFQNTAADGAALIKIEPHSGDVINGQIGSVEFGSVASKGIWNTKATQKKGDWARLRSDGAGNWWVVGGQGVWASEA